MQEILDKLKELIQEETKTDLEVNEFSPTKSLKTITFIDGGHADLFNTGSVLLSFIRVVAITYKDNKKTNITKKECYLLVWQEDNKFLMQTDPELLENFVFDLNDEELAYKNQQVKITKISSLIRRLLELKMAKEQDSDYIVLDGSLESKTEYEKTFLEKLGNKMFGLSKTCELTINNKPITSLLLKQKSEKPFLYKNEDNTMFVKLHPKSKHIFRLDYKEFNPEMLSLLANNSTDPTFLGYPFGLVMADRLARISNQEKAQLQTKIKLGLGKQYQQLEQQLTNTNAHEILDNIS